MANIANKKNVFSTMCSLQESLQTGSLICLTGFS